MDKLEQLCKETNGYITAKDLADQGYTKYQISKFAAKDGPLERVQRGIYRHKEFFDDDFFESQFQNNFIYSNETALYLWNMTDVIPRTTFSVTTTHNQHLRNKELKVYYVKDELYELGVTSIKDEFGNMVRVYDRERTICDIIKNNKKMDRQIYLQGIRNYFFYEEHNLRNLVRYAKAMHILDKVQAIAELFLEP